MRAEVLSEKYLAIFSALLPLPEAKMAMRFISIYGVIGYTNNAIFPLKKEIGLRGVGTGLVSTCLLIGMGLITPVGKYTGTPAGTSLCLATCPAVL